MENAMKHIHRTRGDRVFDAINVAALCLLLAVILYPLIYVLSCSFSDPLLVVQSKITFLPMQPTLVAYQRVFRNELIMTGYQNTLFYTLLGTVLNVAVTTMMAYPLSRHDFAARRPITMLTAFTMLFSGGMIPKIEGLADAIYRGVSEASIIDGRVLHSILLEIFSDRGSGTLFYRRGHVR